MRGRQEKRSAQSGAAYVEVLIAAAVVSIALVPMLDALRAGTLVAEQQQRHVIDHYQLTASLEELLVEPHSTLAAAAAAAGGPTIPTTYSDPPGTPSRRVVFISPYDGDNADTDNDPFTGTDDDLLWIRVQIENTAHALEALTMR